MKQVRGLDINGQLGWRTECDRHRSCMFFGFGSVGVLVSLCAVSFLLLLRSCYFHTRLTQRPVTNASSPTRGPRLTDPRSSASSQ